MITDGKCFLYLSVTGKKTCRAQGSYRGGLLRHKKSLPVHSKNVGNKYIFRHYCRESAITHPLGLEVISVMTNLVVMQGNFPSFCTGCFGDFRFENVAKSQAYH